MLDFLLFSYISFSPSSLRKTLFHPSSLSHHLPCLFPLLSASAAASLLPPVPPRDSGRSHVSSLSSGPSQPLLLPPPPTPKPNPAEITEPLLHNEGTGGSRNGWAVTVAFHKKAAKAIVSDGNMGVLPDFRDGLKPVLIIYSMHRLGFSSKSLLDFRCCVIERCAKFKISQAQERRHIVEGFVLGIDNLCGVIDIIRKYSRNAAACPPLRKDVNLSEKQAQAIVVDPVRTVYDCPKRKGYVDEIKSLTEHISKLEELLSSRDNIVQLIEQEAVELKRHFSDPRRTMLVASDDGQP